MADNYKTTALIAVKGDSERVSKKNIRPFGDTTLIDLKLRQLIKSKSVDSIFVSSESDEILNLCSEYEGVICHKRDDYYSSPSVEMSEVYKYLASEIDSEIIMWVPVTNPLTKPTTYKQAMDKFFEFKDQNDCLLSCIPVNDYILKDYKPLNFTRNPWQRSQDLQGLHSLSFAVNILKRSSMIEWGSLVGHNPYYLELSSEESIDIDYMIDFQLCEYLYNKNPQKYL